MFYLEHPWALLAAIGPVLIFLASFAPHISDAIVPSLRLFNIRRSRFFSRRRISLLLIALAAFFICLQLAGLRIKIRGRGEDAAIMLVLDISGSMEARDVMQDARVQRFPDGLKTPRLDIARQIASEIIDSHKGPIGLAAFAGKAYLVMPPQMNFNEDLKGRLNELAILPYEDGTAIGDAILCALRGLQDNSAAAIILFSDGADHASKQRLDRAMELARERRIPVNAVCLGSPEAYVPSSDETGKVAWKKVDKERDAELLRRLAAETGGKFMTDLEPPVQMLHAGTQTSLRDVSLEGFWVYAAIVALLLSQGPWCANF